MTRVPLMRLDGQNNTHAERLLDGVDHCATVVCKNTTVWTVCPNNGMEGFFGAYCIWIIGNIDIYYSILQDLWLWSGTKETTPYNNTCTDLM